MNLQELLNDHQLYHSDFQMDNIITVRAGGTLYGQYKQALRELFKRYRGLKQLYTERELLQVDIEELTEKLETIERFERRRAEINRTQKIMSIEEMYKNIKDTEREFKRFYAQAVALKNQIGDLTPEKRNKLDQEMWEYKLKEMACVDFVSQGRLSNVTYEMLISAPAYIRFKLLDEIKDHEKLLNWYESKDDISLQLSIQEVNIKTLLDGEICI